MVVKGLLKRSVAVGENKLSRLGVIPGAYFDMRLIKDPWATS